MLFQVHILCEDRTVNMHLCDIYLCHFAPIKNHFDCPVGFCWFFNSHCMVPHLSLWTLLTPPHVPHPSSPAVFTSFWLPPTPSRQTHTASSFSFFLTLISQGSTPVLLLFLLMTYFASGFCLSPTSTPLSCLLLSSFLILPITPSGNFMICF